MNNISSAMSIPRLTGMINNRSSEIHRIDEQIERLEGAISDCNKAIDSFRQSVEGMKLLETEVALVFKGEASESFKRKLMSYSNFCAQRMQHMESLKTNYSRQIDELNHQKAIAQDLINRLRESIAKIRTIEVHRFS